MATSRTSFQKLQRDRAKKEKQIAKRDRRLDKPPEDGDETIDLALIPEGEEIPPDQLLKMVAEIHEQFEAGTLTFEEFEERKTELFARISTD